MDVGRLMWLGMVLLASANQAAATLGQAPSDLGAAAATAVPAARALAVTTNAQSGLYKLQATQLENGTTVQEFATLAGVVFALSWRGPVLPDLSALLGSYFSAFKAETDRARSLGKRGSPVKMVSDSLVVNSNGRMRSFFGYAYAPDLIPEGLKIDDLLQ